MRWAAASTTRRPARPRRRRRNIGAAVRRRMPRRLRRLRRKATRGWRQGRRRAPRGPESRRATRLVVLGRPPQLPRGTARRTAAPCRSCAETTPPPGLATLSPQLWVWPPAPRVARWYYPPFGGVRTSDGIRRPRHQEVDEAGRFSSRRAHGALVHDLDEDARLGKEKLEFVQIRDVRMPSTRFGRLEDERDLAANVDPKRFGGVDREQGADPDGLRLRWAQSCDSVTALTTFRPKWFRVVARHVQASHRREGAARRRPKARLEERARKVLAQLAKDVVVSEVMTGGIEQNVDANTMGAPGFALLWEGLGPQRRPRKCEENESDPHRNCAPGIRRGPS